MKVLFLIAFLLLTVSGLRAQETYLGQTKDEIFKTLSSSKTIQLQDSSITSDGLLHFYQYRLSEISDFLVYFNSDNICTLFVYTCSEKAILSLTVQDLNKKFNNIGSYEWIDKDARVGVKLQVGEAGFTLVYKRL